MRQKELEMISFTIDKSEHKDLIDEIDVYVQEIGGRFAILRNVVEFYIPQEYRYFIILKYPFLQEVAYYQ